MRLEGYVILVLCALSGAVFGFALARALGPSSTQPVLPVDPGCASALDEAARARDAALLELTEERRLLRAME